jgi:hypothetical protein
LIELTIEAAVRVYPPRPCPEKPQPAQNSLASRLSENSAKSGKSWPRPGILVPGYALAPGVPANSSADATTPPAGITPPPRIFPVSSTSGVTPARSAPPQAAQAGLDLVEDHHRAGHGARLPDLPQVTVGRQPDAAHRLDGLQQHRRVSRQPGSQRVSIAERHEVDHRQQRAERVAVPLPPGHRQRAERLAVESAGHGDHVTLAGQPAGATPARSSAAAASSGLRNSLVARGLRSSCARTAATTAGWPGAAISRARLASDYLDRHVTSPIR